MYSFDLKRWFRAFSSDSFYIGFFSDLKKKPKDELAKISDFLGISGRGIDTSFISNVGKKNDNVEFPLTTINEIKDFVGIYNEELWNMLGISPKR